MSESSCVPKSENCTHDHSRVGRICEEGYILWFRYDVSPAEFHVDSEIDV